MKGGIILNKAEVVRKEEEYISNKRSSTEEFKIAQKDLESAKLSFENEYYKWTIIQSYYAIFHSIKALLFKDGYTEELPIFIYYIFKEIYIKNKVLPMSIYKCLKSSIYLKKMAEYKEVYSKEAAEKIAISACYILKQIKKLII